MSERGAARHRARERALELAYEAEIKGRSPKDILAALVMAPDPYTVTLLMSFEDNRAWADDLLTRHSTEWPLERMAMVDRLVMSLALCELRTAEPPPKAVVLDEAVELAKAYSTDNSPAYVNGVLSACVSELS